MPTYLLGIESSCDETAAAVLGDGKILSNVIAGQEVHRSYGGVVPELASRAHQQHIVPVVTQALREAKLHKNTLNGVAFTRGPGLLGALLVGSSFAKGLAWGLDCPLIGVNHMQAHVLAHFIEAPRPQFPFLCLTVSGGHTQLVRVEAPLEMTVIGETRDDAAGEAFDKTAKLLGLPYPGGPLIDRYAQKGDPEAYAFPEPDIEGLDFSFSGLKTAILYFLNKKQDQDPDFIRKNRHDLCASIQQRIVHILLNKLIQAAEQENIHEVAIAGGVSANSALRKQFEATGKVHGWHTYIPAFAYCTDNAAMIAMAGYYKYQAQEFDSLAVTPTARFLF